MSNVISTTQSAFSATFISGSSSVPDTTDKGFQMKLETIQQAFEDRNANVSTGGFTNFGWIAMDETLNQTSTTGGDTQSEAEHFAAVGCELDTPEGNFTFAAASLNASADYSGTFGNGEGAFAAHLDANGKSSISVLERADLGGLAMPDTRQTLERLSLQATEDMFANLTKDTAKELHRER